VFSIRDNKILSIVLFPSLIILILANIIDISFASDISNQLTNNLESENNIMKSNNSINNEDICMRYENITKTIIVCNGMVDIPTIYDFIDNNSDILEMKGEKEWILKSNILILEKGTLNISDLNTRLLKIDSDSSNNLAYSIISRGNLIIDNTNITSWNSTTNEVPELSPGIPRAYIWTFWNSAGKTNITNSFFENLGYKSHLGTTGLAFFSGHGSLIQNNTIINNYFGLHFANKVSNITIKNNSISKSQFDGINLDSNTNNIDILENRIFENNFHAIVCKKDCNNIKIKNNILENNIGIGILLERNSSINYVELNNIRSNTMGMMVSESPENDIKMNNFVGNGNGIFLKNTKNNLINSNNITNSNNYGINIYNNSTNNIIQGNNIKKSMNSGINIADYGTNNNKLINNNIVEGTNYGLKFDKTSKNILKNNIIENNQNDDFFIRQSKDNMIINSFFNYTGILLNDKKSNMVITDTMNRIIDGNNITNTIYKQNNTIILKPNNNFTKLKTTDMSVNPESSYINITKVNYNTEKNNEYKRIDLVYPEVGIATKFTVGGFNPGSQVLVKVNKEIKDLITIGNNNNTIEFNLKNDQLSYRLEFELTTTPVLITIIILSILILISIVIFLFIRKKRKTREINNRNQKFKS
jgi:parallel beta-helix repeat protein